jgi:hypothetical protein
MTMNDWRSVHIGFSGDGLTIDGISIWDQKWRRCGGDTLWLPHPVYPQQRHQFDLYEVGDVDRPLRFAAGEVSNSVWGFYVPA